MAKQHLLYYNSLKKDGKEQEYNHPDDLLSKAFEYFAWCSDNPWTKKELMRSGDRKGEIQDIPVSRPYTLSGLCVYCGISENTFTDYSQDTVMKDATIHILNIIRQHQAEGALNGTYSSAFVSRLLDQTWEQYLTTEAVKQQPFIINVTDQEGKEVIEQYIYNVTSNKGA